MIAAPFPGRVGIRKVSRGRLRPGRHLHRQPREDRRAEGRLQAAGDVPAQPRCRPGHRDQRRCAARQVVPRRDLRHRSACRRQRPRHQGARAHGQSGLRAAARPVRPHRRQGQADARGRHGAGKRHRAARRRDVRVPHRERQGGRGQGRGSDSAATARSRSSKACSPTRPSSPPASRSCATAPTWSSSSPAVATVPPADKRRS